MFNLRAIAQQLGLPSPIGKNDIIRWLAGRPLDFAPGTDYAYSNVGYLVLGQIVEASTGRTFMDEARDLFAPFQHEGFAEIQLGRSLPADRLPYEPIYLDPYTTFSLFPPYGVVAWPDGGLLMEAFEAHGGLLASSAAIARFSSNFWLTGAPRTGNGQNWIAYGSMPGTLTMARQLPNGVNLVTLFNTRVDTANAIIDPETIRTLLEPIVLQINWSALDAK
jgi:CubicO group peptidase (beta-lactamase class C family)